MERKPASNDTRVSTDYIDLLQELYPSIPRSELEQTAQETHSRIIDYIEGKISGEELLATSEEEVKTLTNEIDKIKDKLAQRLERIRQKIECLKK